MPKYFYHATTVDNHKKIKADGYIKPSSGNTYKDAVFLASNDYDARIIAAMRHATFQSELFAIIKIPKFMLKKKYLEKGDKHGAIAQKPTWKYTKPIPITDDVLEAIVPVTLNLPAGVSITRDNGKVGLGFASQEIYDQYMETA